MLHGALQQPEGRAIQKHDEESAERVQNQARFVAAFIRQVARAGSLDLVLLCAYSALKETGLSKEDVDVEAFVKTLRTEQEENSWWPKDFM